MKDFSALVFYYSIRQQQTFSQFQFTPYCLYAGISLLSRPHSMLFLRTNTSHHTKITNQTNQSMLMFLLFLILSSGLVDIGWHALLTPLMCHCFFIVPVPWHRFRVKCLRSITFCEELWESPCWLPPSCNLFGPCLSLHTYICRWSCQIYSAS